MPDVSAPAKFMTANSQRSTPSPTTSINSRNASPDALRCERSQAVPASSARSLVHSLVLVCARGGAGTLALRT